MEEEEWGGGERRGGGEGQGPYLHARARWDEKGVDVVMDVVGECLDIVKGQVEQSSPCV